MDKHILKGDIFLARLSPVIGDEQGGERPVLIIQNDTGNHYSNTTIVAIITSKRKSNMRTHMKILSYHGLDVDSVVMAEQIRTIDKSRLGKKLSHLTKLEQMDFDNCLIRSLSIRFNHASPKEDSI